MAFSLFCILMLSVTSTWGASTTPGPKPSDVMSVLQAQGNFNTLVSLITKAGLVNTLQSVPELMLFAPTDDAFARLPAGTLQALEGDVNRLKSVLTYHAAGETLNIRRQRFQDKTISSLEAGLPIRLNIYKNVHTITAEGVNITTKNIPISNGLIHEIDGVMTPPSGNIISIIESSANMKELNALLTSAGLKDIIQNDMNITVFVPNDDAFTKVDSKIMQYLSTHPNDLKEVLLYHVVASKTLYSIGMVHTLTFPTADNHHDRIMTIEDASNNVFINNAKVLERDISATNGVIHIIDKVLIPAKILVKIQDQGLIVG